MLFALFFHFVCVQFDLCCREFYFHGIFICYTEYQQKKMTRKSNEVLLFYFFSCISWMYFSYDRWTSATVCHYSMLSATCASYYMWRMTLWRCGNFRFLFAPFHRFTMFLNIFFYSHFMWEKESVLCLCVHSVPFVIIVARRDFCRWYEYVVFVVVVSLFVIIVRKEKCQYEK